METFIRRCFPNRGQPPYSWENLCRTFLVKRWSLLPLLTPLPQPSPGPRIAPIRVLNFFHYNLITILKDQIQGDVP